MPEHALHSLANIQACGIHGRRLQRLPLCCDLQFGRLAQQHIKRHIDGGLIKVAVLDQQSTLLGGGAHNRDRTPLALAECLKLLHARCLQRNDVALLGLVAPERQWRHARFVVGNIAQRKVPATPGIRDQLR